MELDERQAIEQHVAECATCRMTVDDLRVVCERAKTLTPMTPPPHIWPKIRRAVERQPSVMAGRHAPPWQWLAAAAVIVLAVAASWRFVRSKPADEAARAGTTASIDAELSLAEQHYQNAIVGLEQVARSEQGSLDPQTAAVLQRNLSIVDQAISESRSALAERPQNDVVRQTLFESFEAKIALLENTIAIVNEVRKGNGAGVASIVSGLNDRTP